MRWAAAIAIAWVLGAGDHANLVVKGQGKHQQIDTSTFAPEQRARYDIFKVRCTKCHPMSRPIAALQTGITPVSGGVFDDDAIKKYVVKMMRKPNSGISREDALEVLLFLRYARALARGETPSQAAAAAESAAE